ncbi:Gfo/Idh/MocA family protein [Paenibacillus rhizophilus]|uniref:Gfo/Idh/MocA family oxidoreductase n=1 Tax=Paenibacillus rhizophilus TaxID=1850366 RepID=A0A3N9P876_9BACL|nr:gfo/Idh/MocA family oxidoreductase [Paenibacillus rhizophilus]
MKDSANINIALIGIGNIARKVYLPLLSQSPRVRIAGILSSSASTVESTVSAYRLPQGTCSLDELLAWDLDAVFVHAPTRNHYEIVTKCLERGLAVYVDKPLSCRLEESVKMAELAESKGLLLGVGFNRRFAPLYAEAKAWLDEAGGITHCSAVKHRTKRQKLSSRETVHDDLIHMLDLLLWLCGNDYELLRGSLHSDLEGRLVQAAGMLGWSGGASGVYSMVRDAGADLEKLELHGHGRSAEIADMERAVLYDRNASPAVRGFGSWDTILMRRGFSGVVDHFLDYIHKPSECGISALSVLPVHRLAAQLTEGAD